MLTSVHTEKLSRPEIESHKVLLFVLRFYQSP